MNQKQYNRQRVKDGQEWVWNLLFGAAFWICVFGSVGERLAFLDGRFFRTGLLILLGIVIACIVLATAVLIWASHRHLKSNWNNQSELYEAGRAIKVALSRISAWSVLSLIALVSICVYVGLPMMAAGLCSAIASVYAIVLIIAHIGNWRAAKL